MASQIPGSIPENRAIICENSGQIFDLGLPAKVWGPVFNMDFHQEDFIDEPEGYSDDEDSDNQSIQASPEEIQKWIEQIDSMATWLDANDMQFYDIAISKLKPGHEDVFDLLQDLPDHPQTWSFLRKFLLTLATRLTALQEDFIDEPEEYSDDEDSDNQSIQAGPVS